MNLKQFYKAKEINKLSYAPYSNYHVSAAILLKNGDIIAGVNIENSSYGLSMCAERSALFKAYSMGVKKDDITSILIYTDRKDSMPYPCGACRQVMRELMPINAEVIIINDNEEPIYQTVESLLPHSFGPESL